MESKFEWLWIRLHYQLTKQTKWDEYNECGRSFYSMRHKIRQKIKQNEAGGAYCNMSSSSKTVNVKHF